MQRPQLKLLYGGKAKYVTVRGIRVSIVPSTLHPLTVDVRVFEEDTHLILTVDPVMRFSEEHPIRLMTEILEDKKKKTGQVVINNNSWYAVVHDLDVEPTCCRKWIEQCCREILRLAERYGVRSIGLPLLGSVHGNFKSGDSLAILLHSIRTVHPRTLEQILVLEQPARIAATRKHLLRLVM